LSIDDVTTAQAAQLAMRQEWAASDPITRYDSSKPQLQKLYDLLKSKKMEVKVLPHTNFGLEHGKAGVITLEDGRKTAFMGSANETLQGWLTNYELVWEDDSPEAVQWVQAEFDYLWTHASAIPLADYVVEDIGRLAHRVVVPSIEVWREEAKAEEALVETPVFAKEFGLWGHQKYFINLAFEAHKSVNGARFVLADQVGLGKTVQLALSAMLMALVGEKPILVIVPKPLMLQWQGELRDLLDMPSAIWNGKRWIDENEIEYPESGAGGIKKCPRRVGIISQGLITRKSEALQYLKEMEYECVIVDEAHRARRSNLAPGKENEKPEPNNLMQFILELSGRTHSLLLSTATPVQLNPIEGWDMLYMLSGNRDFVLGNSFSYWRKDPKRSLQMVMGKEVMPEDETILWDWVRNPLPPSSESKDFGLIRKSLQLADTVPIAAPGAWEKLKEPDKKRVRNNGAAFGREHNPFLRHIVRRTREYLETTLDPATHEPYLKAVEVQLYGEQDYEAIELPLYLQNAYQCAEEFCTMLSARVKNAGFIKTLLLRRVGSSIEAGKITATRMLGDYMLAEEEGEEEDAPESNGSAFELTEPECQKLKVFLTVLGASKELDPKFANILHYLSDLNWLERGCIIFSQYWDSVWWLANALSKKLPDIQLGIYAGGQKSGVMLNGDYHREDREIIKARVKRGEIKLLLGTDAASEGLNLQRLGTLINLDLPWNPTRLEQRKGRIQRIGQLQDKVFIYNMRYKDSVEDRVHQLLSERLQSIRNLFGQLPDTLEDVWVYVAENNMEKAQQTIAAVPEQHPFEIKYHRIESVPWERCARVLDATDRRKYMAKAW
jgi:ERCC4-related helicase